MKKVEPNKKTNKEKQKDLNQKLNMFDRLPDHCYTCEAPFDRKNKQQVQSWFVTVRNAEQSVKVYCPECWNKAQKSLQKLIDDFNEGKVKNVSEKPNL